MKKISIIVPVYNSCQYLERCINSLLNQKNVDDLQIILVNDGSQDASEEIIDRYVKEYPDNIIKINKANGGQASARNRGIEIADSEYLLFIDSDDYIENNCLDKLYSFAQSNNNDLVVFDYYEIENNRKIKKEGMNCLTTNNNINYLLGNASPWNKLIKTQILKDNNIKFLENYIYEDLATMPIIAGYAKNVGYYKYPLYYYIIRDGSTMRQKDYNEKLESIYYAMNHLETQFRERNLFTKYKEELEYLYIDHLLYAATGRFLNYKNSEENLQKIVKIIKSKYPNWRNNKYYKNKNFIYKLTCNIFYSENKCIIKLYNKFRNSIK